jgi:hypothetical protein
MQAITPGHSYYLRNFEPTGAAEQFIQFIHKEPCKDPAMPMITVANGTTNEEVLRVLIDRMNYLQAKMPCRENAIVITKLEECLMWLEKRTGARKARNVEGTNKE